MTRRASRERRSALEKAEDEVRDLPTIETPGSFIRGWPLYSDSISGVYNPTVSQPPAESEAEPPAPPRRKAKR